jgi:hypothetical protein
MCAPTLRRGAFFVAGAAWVLHAHPAMRGGEYTATAGMGHDEACRQQAEWVRIGRRSAAADSRPASLRQRAHLPSQGHQVEVGQIFSIEESELASAACSTQSKAK